MKNVEQAVVQVIEKQLDEVLDQELDEKQIEQYRKQRILEIKRQNEQRVRWQEKGHGNLTEINRTLEFFDIVRDCSRAVCFFYPAEMEKDYAEYIIRHLRLMSTKHCEARFLYANISKLPFLKEKLMLNDNSKCTIGVVVDSVIRGYLGLSAHKCKNVTYEQLEWQLESTGVIDLDEANRERKALQQARSARKSIRDGIQWLSDGDSE